VRELRNLMERVVILTPGPRIDADDLPATLGVGAGNGAAHGSLEQARKDFEREFLRARLAEHGWNISRTAEAIGIARESLSRKIKTHKLEQEPRG
jgi:two-component system nitrogen regulation response regulator NtrX